MATLPPLDFDLSGIDVPSMPGGVNAASPADQAYQIFKQNAARRAAFRQANGITSEMLARANSFGSVSAAPSVPVTENPAPLATAEAASAPGFGARAAAAGSRAAPGLFRGLLGRLGIYATALDGGYEAGKLLTPDKVAVGMADALGTLAKKVGIDNGYAGGSRQFQQAQSTPPITPPNPADAMRTAGRAGGPAFGDLDHELVNDPDHPLTPQELFVRDALRANAGDQGALARVQAAFQNGGSLTGYGRTPVPSGSFTDANGNKQVTVGISDPTSAGQLAQAQKAYEDAAAAEPSAEVHNRRYLEARGRALDPSYQRARAAYDAGTVTPSLMRDDAGGPILGTQGGIFANLARFVNNYGTTALSTAVANRDAKLGIKQGELAVRTNDSIANRENQAQNAESNRIKAYTDLLKEITTASKPNVKVVTGLDGNPIIVDQNTGAARKVVPQETPTWEKFRDAARQDPRNKALSDDQLKAYYNKTYGAGSAPPSTANPLDLLRGALGTYQPVPYMR